MNEWIEIPTNFQSREEELGKLLRETDEGDIVGEPYTKEDAYSFSFMAL